MTDLSHLIRMATRREQDRQETLQWVVELLQTRNREVERLEQELADLRRRLTSKEDYVEALCRLFAELRREKLSLLSRAFRPGLVGRRKWTRGNMTSFKPQAVTDPHVFSNCKNSTSNV